MAEGVTSGLNQRMQFTSDDFTGILEQAGIRTSMDGRGRVYDNIFVERLWWTVNYEEVYLHDYRTVSEVRLRLANYLHFYNRERIHETFNYKTPYGVHFKEPCNLKTAQADQTTHHIQAHFLSWQWGVP